MNSTRRLFLRRALASSAAVALAPHLLAQSAPSVARPAAPPKPPALAPDLVQGVVGAAHRSLEEVKRLVEATPLLVHATWDWGGGDFETPLQAAAHTGQRAIAEYLLSRQARIDLFASAMLGQLGLVQAAFAVDPKVHEIPGPHGFTLMHCALRGGEAAKPVVDWLRAQGVPEETHRPLNFIFPPS